jgi:hypothetical protein
MANDVLVYTVQEGVLEPEKGDRGRVPSTSGWLVLGCGKLVFGGSFNVVSGLDGRNVRVGTGRLRGDGVDSTLLDVGVLGDVALASALGLKLLSSKNTSVEILDATSLDTFRAGRRLRAAEEERTLDDLPGAELPVVLDDTAVEEGDEDCDVLVCLLTCFFAMRERVLNLQEATIAATTIPVIRETMTAHVSLRSILADPPFQQMSRVRRKAVRKK